MGMDVSTQICAPMASQVSYPNVHLFILPSTPMDMEWKSCIVVNLEVLS